MMIYQVRISNMAELSRQNVAIGLPHGLPAVVAEGRLVVAGVWCGVRRGRFLAPSLCCGLCFDFQICSCLCDFSFDECLCK